MNMMDENLCRTIREQGLTHGGVATYLMGVSASSETLFAAWCAFLYRRFEQDSFDVEILDRHHEEWVGRIIKVEVQGDEPAHDFANRTATSFGTAAQNSRIRSGACAFGFSHFDESTAHREGDIPSLCGDLHLICVSDDLGVKCSISYDHSRYEEAVVEQMLAQYRALLMALSTHSDEPLRHLPMLSAEEQQKLLDQLSGPELAPSEYRVFQLIEKHAAERPDAIAVNLNTDSLTYDDLNRAANRMARWLVQRGVERGSRVAVCMEPRVDFMVCMLAIFKAGATHVPLDPGYPDERLAVILEDTSPTVLLTEASLFARLSALSKQAACLEHMTEELIALSDDNLDYHVDAAQIAYIVYTSGTTGKPKGVMVSHASLSHYIGVAQTVYGYTTTDIIPAVARYTFSITFFELLSPLAAGGRLVLLERNHVLDMPRLVKTLTEATCIHCSPSLWRKIIGYIDEQGLAASNFRNMRHVSSGGDMVPPDVLESLKRIFDHAEVFVIYGCSEISCMGCTYLVPRDRVIERTRVGKPFPNMTLRLLDGKGQLVPPGVIGEVCFGGAGLATGYLNQPELTAEKFFDFNGERLYRTGDLGRLDSEGNLELVGRSDFQIKLRGIRMEAAEIEANLRAMPGVKDAVVAAPTLQDGEKRLVAFVVPDPSTSLTARQLREFLKVRLPDYMVPAAFVFMDALPVNVNQKVDRLALSRMTSLPDNAAPTEDPPRTEIERRLVAIWEKVLQVKGIGIRDEFWDVGGDSLRSVALMSEIDRELGVALPVSTLFTNPTIEQLAVLCEARDDDDSLAESLICLRRGTDERPAVFFVHDGAGESMPYRTLAMLLHEGHSVYGIHPKSTRHHPILHTRLDEVVDYYIEQIKSVQPKGPYFVGGLCIGGFLAFEIGRKLAAAGEMVGPIGLIDVGHVSAPKRGVTSQRLNRLSSDLKSFGSGNLLRKAFTLSGMILRRARNVIVYEATSRYTRHKTRLKIKLMRAMLDRGMRLPKFLRGISVDAVLRFAEKEYVVPPPYQGETLLFRATSRDPALDKIVNDTPYIEIFVDPLLGWEDKVSNLAVYDVPAGHSSTLRAPHVQLVANAFQRHIDMALQSLQEQ